MCSIFQIQIDPLKFITDTLKALSRPIGYLQDPEHQITRLTDAINHIRAQKEDCRNRIRHAEHAGEVPTHEAEYWFTKVDNFIAECLKIVDDHKNGSFRWGIHRRAVHILADIKAFHENPKLVILTTMLPPKKVQEVPAKPTSVTMDTYLSLLETALEDDKSRIIGIWGMGGVGKTVLLTSLNNKLYGLSEAGQSKENFDYVIWAVASKDYKLEKIQRSIAERLGLSLCEDTVKQAMKIMDFLRNKSFLLLLDDLWQPIDFGELGIPHPTSKQKVVFTTREKSVCGQMQARHEIKIKCLNEEEAWCLFQEKVGEETLHARSGILPLARLVARECAGLPLALVLIGSTMSTKKTSWEWHDAITRLKKSKPYEIQGMGDHIFSKLKFSYDHLENEILRQCFLLCSLWPEDHPILKTDLIEFWMGHGLVHEHKFDNINEAYDCGYSLIGGLQDACLLEPGYNKDKEVKMHGMVRDLALWIASDCGKKPNRFIVCSSVIASNDSQIEVERISLLKSDTFSLPTSCTELKTLMVQKNTYFDSIVPGFFEETRALTYLDLSYTKIYILPEEIGLLGNLRYLNISHTNISSLPLQLGNLQELRFLFLRKLFNIHVPCDVFEKLMMLSVFDMSDTICINLNEILSMLRDLKGVGIVLRSIEDLNQLAQLPNVLTWRLVLKNLRGLNQPLQVLSLSQLGSRNIGSSIHKLTIEDSMSLKVVSMGSDGGGNIQKWCLSRLEELRLKQLPKLHNIVWRGVGPAQMLPSLTMLSISDCKNLSNISWVTQLFSLEDLFVGFCNNMHQIIDDYDEFARSDDDQENGVGTTVWAFRSLRRLRLRDMKSLRVFGGSYTFPSLELLEVYECPEMKTLPFGEEMAGMKLKRIKGWRAWWEELKMEDNVRAMLLPYFQEKNLVDEIKKISSLSGPAVFDLR